MAIDWEKARERAKRLDKVRYEQIKPAAVKASSLPLMLPTAQEKGGAQAGPSSVLSGADLAMSTLRNGPLLLPTGMEQKQEKTPTVFERIGSAGKSIGKTLQATPYILGDALKSDFEATAAAARERGDTGSFFDVDPAAFGQSVNETVFDIDPDKVEQNPNAGVEKYQKPVDPNTKGMQLMGEAYKLREEATEGMSGAGKFLADAGISVASNALLLPTAAISPAIPLAAMGAQSAAQKTYEETKKGKSAGEALSRGIISGAIEAATEKIPLDTLADLVKTGGKSVLKNLLKQAGVEAGEEALSYTANFIADKAARDPDASFSVEELLTSAAAGGVSGLFFGVGGSAVNAVTKPKGLQTYEQAQQARKEQAGQGNAAVPEAKGLPTGTEPAAEQGNSAPEVKYLPTDREAAEGQEKTVSTGEAVVKEYQKKERHGEILDAIRTKIKEVETLQPVARLTGEEFQKTPEDTRNLRTKVIDFFNSIGNKVVRGDIGEIELGTSGARDSTAHGYGKLKAATFAALPQVLQNGKIIDFKGPYEGHDYDSRIISAPVMVGNEKVYVGALIIKDRTQRYKLHEVLTTNENGAPLFKSEAIGHEAGGPLRNDTPLGEPEGSLTDPTVTQTEQGVKEEYARQGANNTVKPEHMTDEEWELWQQKQPVKQASAWGTAATDKLSMEEVSSPITTLGAARSLRGLEQGRYEAKKNLDRLLKQAQLTKPAQQFAKDISEGLYTVEQAARLGMDPKVIEEVAEAYRLVNQFNERAIQNKKGQYTAAFDIRTEELIKNSDKATPPGILSLNANTMQRNNERTWGSDAAAINAEFFDPVIENEAKRIRFVNDQLSKMEGYHLTADESAQVQRLMEDKVAESDLRVHGYDVDKLKNAAKTLSHLYSDFYDAINDFLVAHGYKEIGWQKNYAPHMQEEQVGQLQRYLQRLGFQTEVTELPTDIAGRTEDFKPGKQYNPYFQHRVGNKTVYDAVGGFESYVNYLSNVFYHTDDIQKLRRLSEGLRQKYGTEELRAELDRLNHLEDRVVDGEDGLSYQDVEDMKQEAFNRAGTMTKFGAYVSVLDDYTNILAGKQTKVDRAVESLFGRSALNLGKNIQNAFSRAAVMGNLSSAINQTVQLPQLVTELGPKVTTQAVTDVVTGKTAAAEFAKQSAFLTGKRGIQSISEKSTSDKVFDIAAKPFEIVDDFASRVIVRAKYLEQIAAGADHDSALKAADQYAARLVGSRMKGAKPVLFEQKNPISRLATTFQLEVANGWEHIVHDLPQEIKALAEEKGKGAAAKRTAELIIASQLVNFIANEIIKAITGREPVPFDGLGMMANYLASGYGMTKEGYLKALADNAVEKVSGRRPMGTEWTPGKFDLPTGLETLGEDVTEDLPFVGNVTTMLGITDGRLPLPQVWNSKLTRAAGNVGTALTAETDEEKAAAWQKAAANAASGGIDVAATWLPMGSQAKKTFQGTEALLRGGVYSGSGKDAALQYNVEQTPANVVRGVLFGKSALPETDEYWAMNRRALSEGQTDVYKALMNSGMSGQDAYDLIYKLRQTTKTDEKSQTLARLDVLQASGLNSEQKSEVYYGIIASDKEKAFMDRVSSSGTDRAAIADALMELRQVKGTGEGQAERQRAALVQMDYLTEQEKSMLGQQILGDNRWMDYSSADALTVSQMSENGRKMAGQALEAGIDAGTFLDAYEAQKTAKEETGLLGKPIKLSKDRNKKAAIDAATPGLNDGQRRVLYEMFGVDKTVWGALGLAK